MILRLILVAICMRQRIFITVWCGSRPNKQITTIATAAQGMAGSTVVGIWAELITDRTSIYVTTNGGMSLPLPTGVEPGKVVRLDVGVEGLVPLRLG